MSEPRGFVVTQDFLGGRYLQGEWPEQILVAHELMPHLCAGSLPLQIGDDFRIELDNAHAVYRLIGYDDYGNRRCERISHDRTPL